MEKALSKPSKPSKGSLVAITTGVLVILAGFTMYNYFSKSGGEITNQSGQTERLEEPGANTTQEQLTKPEEITKGIGSIGTQETVLGKSNQTTEEWKANDYKNGDIKGKTYTVVKGDTLWEIAQARYNDPYMWTKIRDANADKVGTLSNGNPLITPGQILVLPD